MELSESESFRTTRATSSQPKTTSSALPLLEHANMSYFSDRSKRSKSAVKSKVSGSLNGILVSKGPRQQGLRHSSTIDSFSSSNVLSQGASKKRKIAPIFAASSQRGRNDPPSLIHKANRLIFGNPSFREKQEEVVKAVLANKDVLVLFPTGGGKSLCYQLPAVLSKGVTIVISPLISLIHDQHRSLVERDIPSTFINSTQSKTVTRDILEHISSPQPVLKVLFTTPETLVNSLAFRSALNACYRNGMLARLAVDECHCVSSWGHDFRPDYRNIGKFRQAYPDVPVVALTATASDTTVKDIKRSLKMKNPTVIKKSFNRSNLRYYILPKLSEQETLEMVAVRIKKYPRGTTGIVYCLAQNDTVKVAAFLKLKGIRCDYYHAGMSPSERDLVQAGWSTGRLSVVCATIAYGMGIDKADVRYVIHFCAPKSIEGYFQESGRAGRDGKPSDCVLYYRPGDLTRLKRLMSTANKKRSKKQQERDIERLHAVQDFCENDRECRRQQLLRYFEQGAIVSCNGTCDVCAKRR